MILLKNNPLPLYRQLQDTLEELIRSGALAPDGLLPSERELCRRYGVSHMTVRLALAELERRQLVVRVPGKGTFAAGRRTMPDDQSPRQRQTLALIMEYTSASEFSMRLVAGLKEALQPREADLLLFSAKEERYFELARAGGLAGAIIADPHFHDLRLRQLKKLALPLVVLGQPNQRNIASVDSDNVEVGAALARHLYERGFRRIGFFGYGRDFTVTRDRLAGYKGVLHAAGLPCPRNRILFGEYSEHSGRTGARQLLAAGADAVVCGDDFLAVCVTDQLLRDRVEAGRDFGICGCNNSQMARLHRPSITSMELQPEELGRQLIANLFRQISGNNETENTVVPCHLAVRHSTRRQPAGDNDPDETALCCAVKQYQAEMSFQ
ncbi:substrate-binding domain-containing protein [Victivallis sp. Marseille-Q1083]|uniref:GntR family transcriptional regulator n=1 Tax=Victivallis sp. Marseille-Q1083 TaxID=2717288 RepID=UPI00158BF391|nr:substrate-binding domain-containing protein [Victivallis sp. Marseille-Q1083]